MSPNVVVFHQLSKFDSKMFLKSEMLDLGVLLLKYVSAENQWSGHPGSENTNVFQTLLSVSDDKTGWDISVHGW